MKTKKILFLYIAGVLLIACKPTSNKQIEGQESVVTEKQDGLTAEEQECKEYFDSILDSYEEEVIVVVNKSDKYDKMDEPDDKEGFITIVDKRNGERYSEAPREYINDTLLIDSLQKIAKTAETFIKWYINDNCPIDQDKLFTFSETLGYYIFDMKYGEFYIKELQKTGIVSDSLIRSLRRYFEQSKVDMETMKLGYETDGVIGYDADIIFNSQDLPTPLTVQKMKIKRFDFWGENISVTFDCGSAVRLFYENGEWKIISGGF